MCGFSDLRSVDRFCITSRLPFPNTKSDGPPGGLCGRDLRLSVTFAARHDGPDHPRHLVGERNRSDLRRATGKQLDQPGSSRSMPLGIADDRERADHEQLPQVSISLLGDATSRSLPPLEFCRGTRPIQAAKSIAATAAFCQSSSMRWAQSKPMPSARGTNTSPLKGDENTQETW